MSSICNRFPLLMFLIISNFNIWSQNALDFDGIDDQVTVANASGLINTASGISLSFWVYPRTNSSGWPDFDGYAGFRNDLNADFYLLQLGSNNIEARFRNSAGTDYTITYNGNLNLNSWNHLVLTYNGSTLSLYHDGSFASSIPANGSFNSANEALNIGFTPFSGNNFYLNGRLDDLGLWNRALTSTEVTGLYNACGPDISDSNLVLSYDFNQGIAAGANGSISSLIDGKGNINGMLSGFNLNGNGSNFVSSPLQGTYTLNLNINSCGPYTAPNGQTYSSSGLYHDTIIPSAGCDTIMNLNLTVNIVNNGLSRIASNKLQAQEVDSNAQYQWLNCSTNYSKIVGATGRQFTFVQNGSYAVEVSLNNCTDTSACMTISDLGLTERSPDFTIFINSAQNQLSLEHAAGLFESFMIFDLKGLLILSGSVSAGNQTKIDLPNLSMGIYMISLQGDGIIAHKKQLIQQSQ